MMGLIDASRMINALLFMLALLLELRLLYNGVLLGSARNVRCIDLSDWFEHRWNSPYRAQANSTSAR